MNEELLRSVARQAKLGKRQEAYFLLVYAQGWTHAQVAERYGLRDPDHVRRSLHGAGKRLQQAQERHQNRQRLGAALQEFLAR